MHGNHPGFPVSVFDMIIPPVTPSGRPIRRTQPWRSSEDVVKLAVKAQIAHPSMADAPAFQREDVRQIPVRDMPPVPLGLT